MKPWILGVAVALGIAAAAIAVLVVLRTGASASPTEALGAPLLVDDTATSGIAHSYTGGSLYFEGGGVAAFDCTGDGAPELFLAGGEGTSALYRNDSAEGGVLAFSPIDAPEARLDAVTGAYPIDIDSDGLTDLVVLRAGENVVLRGTGECRFERANELWGIDGGAEGTFGFSATWEPGQSMPTLAFGNYLRLVDLSNETELCDRNVVIRPNGSTYGPPILLDHPGCTLSVLFSDWDRNGGADLRITNDQQYNRDEEEQLWAMSGPTPTLYTREDGWKLVRINGMGIASHDVTGDGFPEVDLTNQGDNKLQSLVDGPDRPEYTDIAIRRGVTAHRPYTGDATLPSTSWHPEFDDVNNDGFIDLYISKGNVDAMPDFASFDPNNLLIGQPDGTFVEGGLDAGIVYPGSTRGAAVVDLNHDGLLDLVEVNRMDSVRLWRNVGSGAADAPSPMGNWVEIAARQDGPNRDGVGSWIEVRVGDLVMVREVTIGGGHASGELGPHHFGIGPADGADVRVTWPDGSIGPWQRIDAGRRMVVERDAG